MVHLICRHAVPVFLMELQKWVSQHSSDTTTKIFEETESENTVIYKMVESCKVSDLDLYPGHRLTALH